MHISWTGAGRDALDHALARAAATGPHWIPLFLAVRDQGCGLMMVAQSPQRFDVPEDRPHIVIIGDDMARSLGPPGFHLRSVRRFAKLKAAADEGERRMQTAEQAVTLALSAIRLEELEVEFERVEGLFAKARAEVPTLVKLAGTIQNASAAAHQPRAASIEHPRNPERYVSPR